MQLAKAVANAAAALVLKAKNVAQKTEDSAQQNRVIAAATQCALSTSQLVACTRVSSLRHMCLELDIDCSPYESSGKQCCCWKFRIWIFFMHVDIINDFTHLSGGGSNHKLPSVSGAAD